ncbi:unnamed protein product [Brachionus calyciflorus]|uniref:Carboxylic ester hydrolase n=1 Tax=Brachionus calyciflorus TaxID=104777 RepID=A0A813M3W9_9BILA|nr:unnamed protein product [Brachionus calyciflorus]
MISYEISLNLIFILTVAASNYSNDSKTHRRHNKLIINTENGYVKGRVFNLDDDYQEISVDAKFKKKAKYKLHAWLGIPFAEKPIDELRFKRPIPVKNWNGVLNATESPNSCYQLPDMVIMGFDGIEMWNPNTHVSEDCLYLNIWAPASRSSNTPVLVWIYGGGFYSGTSTLKIYDPRVIVSETNLIFVSIQYRVSIFGFLYMNHENAPGNQGLLDQYLGLKWIYNNIQYFGGNNSKITIFGESAGSVSVSLHLLSKLSERLFNNAIMESGSALADWAILEGIEAFKRNKEIIKSFGCNGTVEEMIDCARKVDSKTAIEKSDEHFFTKANHGVAQFTFLPVVDNYFLEDEPINLLNRGKFKKCPILLGSNKDEGNWFFVYAFPEYRNLTATPTIDYELFKDLITSLFYFYPQFPSTSSKAIINSVIYRYTSWNNVHNTKKNFENLDDAAGDFHFVCPVVDFANIYALNSQDVYLYYYTQRSSKHHWPEWLGVMHGDEISFVFGEPLYKKLNYTPEEIVLSKKILKYWSNFARYSDPNGDKNLKSEYAYNSKTIKIKQTTSSKLNQIIEYWPKYQIAQNPDNDSQRAYIDLNSEKIKISYNLRAEYCTFWGSFIPTLVLSESECHCSTCLRNQQKSLGKTNSPNYNIAYLLILIVTRTVLVLIEGTID